MLVELSYRSLTKQFKNFNLLTMGFYKWQPSNQSKEQAAGRHKPLVKTCYYKFSLPHAQACGLRWYPDSYEPPCQVLLGYLHLLLSKTLPCISRPPPLLSSMDAFSGITFLVPLAPLLFRFDAAHLLLLLIEFVSWIL